MRRVEAPLPQPTSATRAPASSFAFTRAAMESRSHQIRGVAGAKELLTTVENAVVVLMPAHSRARAKRLGDARHRGQ